jgi:choline dehydrogenase
VTAAAARPDAEYDYVVVGSGAGGGPVAANLAEAGHRVLLLEAGLDTDDDDYQVPAFHGRATEHPGMSWPFYVRHFDDQAQQERDEKFVPERDGVLYPRSGTLGGCTAHNAMITMYPHDADWNGIAEVTGDPSWRADQMRQWFERLEACGYRDRPRMLPKHPWLARLLAALPLVSDTYVNRSRHGFDGWLRTSLADPALAIGDGQVRRLLKHAAAKSLVAFLGRPLRPWEGLNSVVDPNDWRYRNCPEGLWQIPLAVRDGRRNGTRERIRDVARRHPDRLVVRTGALVTRVLFDDGGEQPVARGVEYLPQAHAYRADPHADPGPAAEPVQVRVRSEVVLAGGAFNTPQLLQLSGIGPRADLERLGIGCRVDLPGVGANLQDRYEVGVVTKMRRDFSLLEGLTFRPPAAGEEPDRGYAEWLEQRRAARRRPQVEPPPPEPRPDRVRAAGQVHRLLPGLLRRPGAAQLHVHLGRPQGPHRQPCRHRAAPLGRSAGHAGHPVPVLRRGRRHRAAGRRRRRHRHRGGPLDHELPRRRRGGRAGAG